MDSSFRKNAQTIKDTFEKIIKGSKRKPCLIENDRGKDFHNNTFQDFLKKTRSKFFKEIVHLVLFLQNALTVL